MDYGDKSIYGIMNVFFKILIYYYKSILIKVSFFDYQELKVGEN